MSAHVHYGADAAICRRGGPAPHLTADRDAVTCSHCRTETRPTIGPATRLEHLVDEHTAQYPPKGRYDRAWSLRRFARWCRDHDVDALAPRRVDLDRYRGELTAQPWAANTVNSHLTALRAFYLWMAEEGHLSESPAQFVKPVPRPRQSTRLALALGDLARLLEHVDAEADPYVRAWVHVLAATSTRPHEVLAVDVQDVGRYDGALTLRLRRRKTGTAQHLRIPEPAATAVRAAIGDRTRGPLILDEHTGRRLSTNIGRDRFARLVAGAGVPRITPACLRTTWMTVGRRIGVQLDELMVGAGHSTLTQTLYYSKIMAQLEGAAAEAISAAVTEERRQQALAA